METKVLYAAFLLLLSGKRKSKGLASKMEISPGYFTFGVSVRMYNSKT